MSEETGKEVVENTEYIYSSMSPDTKWDIDNRVSANTQIMQAEWYDDLMEVISSEGDVEEFIRQKDQKHKQDHLDKVDAPKIAEKSKLQQDLQQLNNKLKTSEQLEDLNTFIHHEVQDLIEMYPKSKHYQLKKTLEAYSQTGEFSQEHLAVLTEQPKGMLDKLRHGGKIKQANERLQSFINACQRNDIYNEINNSSEVKAQDSFRRILEQDSDYNITDYKTMAAKQRLEIKKQIEETNQSIKNCDSSILLNHERFETDPNLIFNRDTENTIIRNFVSETKSEMANPPRLKVNDYVERLDNMADDELVMFNFSLSNGTSGTKKINSNNGKINKIFKSQGLEFGEGTDKWLLRRQGGGLSDELDYELWSPIMTAKEAKEKMPKLVYAMDKAGISKSLIIPTKPADLLLDVPILEERNPQLLDRQSREFVTKLHMDRKDSTSWDLYDDDTKKKISDIYSDGSIDAPPPGWGSHSTTKEAIMKEFPEEKYLFSGTCVSDDYFSLSRRAGRTGSLYATPTLNYAMIYDGVTEGYNVKGASATGDVYVSSVVGAAGGEDIEVGFINVYERSAEDKFFRNFGCDDGRKARTGISVDEAINGYQEVGGS